MGSTAEIQNSEIGAGFGIHSDGQGGAQVVPGQFGNALATTGGTTGSTGGYLTMSPNDFFAPDKTKGTVEAWVQKRIQRFVAFQDPLVNIFGVVPFGGGYFSIYAFWADTLSVGGMQFVIRDTNNVAHTAADPAFDNEPIGQWIHLAFVWDL